MIAAATAGLHVDVVCPCGRLAMTRSEAHRRARAWWRLLRIRMAPYTCPICGHHHLAKKI